MSENVSNSENIAARVDALMSENEGMDLYDAIQQATEDDSIAVEVASRATLILRECPDLSRSQAVNLAFLTLRLGTTHDMRGIEAEQQGQDFDPFADTIKDGVINWAVLANDAMILRLYGMQEYDAVKKVFGGLRDQFVSRLRAELKARSRAKWKEETFERLKKEFES